MDKLKLKPLSAQYRRYASLLLAFAMVLTGSVSFFIFRDMYMERRDQYYSESLTAMTDDLTQAVDNVAYTATGIYAYFSDLIVAYCQAETSSEQLVYYRNISDSFADSVYNSEKYTNTYNIYFIFPDDTQLSWGTQRTLWQGNYYLFNTLPRQPVDVDLPAGASEGSTLWVYENNVNFNELLFFALEVPVGEKSFLIVVSVSPEAVFASKDYQNMALLLADDTLLCSSEDTPFRGVSAQTLTNQLGRIEGNKLGILKYDSRNYIIFGKISSHLGLLLLAEHDRDMYPYLRSALFLYPTAAIVLFIAFYMLIRKASAIILLPLSRLSQALSQNNEPLSAPVTLPEPTRRTERWLRRYSIRSKMMIFYIASSVTPALILLILCAVFSRNAIAQTLRYNVEKSISGVSQSLSDHIDNIREIGKSIIFLDDTQMLMMSEDDSAQDDECKKNLTDYLLYLQPDVSYTNVLFINIYDMDRLLRYSSNNVFSFSDNLNIRAQSFIDNQTVTTGWFYEIVGNSNAYSFYRKAYKKSVDRQSDSSVPAEPMGFPQIGYLQVGVLENTLRSEYSMLNLSEGIECMILDGNDVIISSVDKHLIGLGATEVYPDFADSGSSPLYRYTVIHDIEESDGWRLYVRVEDTKLAETALRILFFSSYVLLAVLGLVWLFTWLILRKITYPINHLVSLTRQQTSVELPQPYRYKGHAKEVSVLVNSFNEMLERLQEQIVIRHTVEKQKQETELIALQSQINPHFLYNVFASISFTMLRGQTEDAANMLDMVGRLFRTGIYRGHPIVSMEEEIKHVQTYLDIQLIRYSHKLTVRYELDPAIFQYDILKLTLQPLVENSIYHGIEIKDGPGTIVISIKALPGKLEFIIRDDGVGIESEELIEIQNGLSRRNLSRGIGLNNVNERIKLYFGDQYGLVIESARQGGTVVTMTQPLITHPQKKEDKPCIPS